MRSLTLHLKILITALVTLGIAITAYQILALGIPVTEDETDDLWNIDAKVEFIANPKDSVKVQMFVPPLAHDYISLNESFISNNYGVSVNRADGNRKVTWSARRATGNQTLYYRLVLTKRYSGEKPKVKGPIFRDSMTVEGPEKIAAEALLAPIRQHSADVETFITEAIKRVNNLNDDNVKLLLAGDNSASTRPGSPSCCCRSPTYHWKRPTPFAWMPSSRRRNSGCAASMARNGCTSTRIPVKPVCRMIACCGGPVKTLSSVSKGQESASHVQPQ